MTFVVAPHPMLKEMHYFFSAASYEYTAAMGVLAILDVIGKREREKRKGYPSFGTLELW